MLVTFLSSSTLLKGGLGLAQRAAGPVARVSNPNTNKVMT